MPRSLTTLLAIDARLAAAIARAEQPRPRRPHQPRRHRVEGQIVTQIALPRFLVWHSYLASRKPTKASMLRAAHRMRGIVLQRLATWMHDRGLPLPVKHGMTPPAWVMAHLTRAAMPSVTRQDEMDDPELWWDEYGDWPDALEGLAPEEIAAWGLEGVQGSQDDLSFQEWIQSEVMTDLGVLQVLSAIWNGDATAFAGQETLGEMGIAGNFNLVDPAMMQFLLNNAGVQVGGQLARIDATERQALAQALYDNMGGAEGMPGMSIPQLARAIQDAMNQYGGTLAGMSTARAMLIANTEVARAETFGQYLALLGSGVQQVQWLTTTGACSVCADNELSSPIHIRQQFPSGHLAPPAHPQCRCSISAWIDPSAPFDPNAWANAPSNAAIQQFFADPAWASWPNMPDDVDWSALRAAQPQPRIDEAMMQRGREVASRLAEMAQGMAHEGELLKDIVAGLTPQRLAHADEQVRGIIRDGMSRHAG